MKKIISVAVAAMFMFACSNDIEGLTDEEGGQIFEINALNEPTSGVFARSLPEYSQEAMFGIEQMNLYVFQNNGTDYVYFKTYPVPGWSKGDTFLRFTVPDNEKLAAGDYMFLLVGGQVEARYFLTAPVAGTTKIEEMPATITAPGHEPAIFAGLQAVRVTSESVLVRLQLSRTVARILSLADPD